MRNQTLTDFEWYLIDDCSLDGSYELLCELLLDEPRAMVIQNPKNEGFGSVGLDRLLSRLKGDYLYKIDGDDLCAPTYLETLSDALDRKPDASMAAARCLYMDENDEVWGRNSSSCYDLKSEAFYAKMLCGNFLCAPGLLYRMNFVRQTGGFFISRELRSKDWYMNLRAAQAGDLYYHGEALACYRQHANNWSKIAFKTADWGQVYGSCFLPVLLGFEDVERSGRDIEPELRQQALDAAGRVAWMVFQRASKTGVKADEVTFRREISRLCPGFDFSMDLTRRSWRQHVPALMQRFKRKHVSQIFPISD